MKAICKTFVYLSLCWIGFTGNSLAQNLSSLPGASHVLLLDFNGHSDNSGWWSSATFPDPIVTAACPYDTAQIREVFNRVSEDFRPFNINVTTSEAVYNAAAASNRQRVVFTAESGFYTDENGGAGGVAYLFTYGSGEIACYVFTNFLGSSAKNAAEAASHEAGHTLGLQHHGRFNSDCTINTEYHSGQGSGQGSWGPIMGAPYSRMVTTWYTGATNEATCTDETQDDLSVILTNGFSYRTDDVGNNIAGSLTLNVGSSPTIRTGIISTNTDVDVFKITTTTPGFYNLSAVPYSLNSSTMSGANLDIKMWITNASGTQLFMADDTSKLAANLENIQLQAGTYYISLDGTGVKTFRAIGGNGSLDYGSIGQYTLTLTRLCKPIITSSVSGSRCGPGTCVLSAATTSGTINWYATNTSSTVLGTGASFTTPSLSANTTYYVGATANGCATPSNRVAVTATVNAIPAVEAGANQSVARNTGNVTLSPSPTGGTWTGTGVSSNGVFNSNQEPGTYKLRYCYSVPSTGCGKCDSLFITVTGTPTQTANPVISPGTGSYTSNQTVSISSATQGATIYYTLTGNTPVIGTGFTRLYTGPFLLTQTTTVKAMAVSNGLSNSAVVTAVLTINNASVVATPIITPATGSYSGQQNVSISTTTSGSTIYYTTNGNVPSTSVNSFTRVYTGSFLVNTNTTVRAIAVKAGLTNSAVAVSFITITNPTQTVATPVITPGTGTYAAPQTVSITCATPGSSIYYTTSGNTPVIGTSFTRLYTGSFQILGTTTVRAMATASGQINSNVAVAYLTLTGARPGPSTQILEQDNEINARISLENENWILYPNPSEGKIFIKSGELPIEEIQVFQMDGRLVRQILQPGEEVSTEGIAPGLYLIRVRDERGWKSRKHMIR
jgi:hypothetical protein